MPGAALRASFHSATVPASAIFRRQILLYPAGGGFRVMARGAQTFYGLRAPLRRALSLVSLPGYLLQTRPGPLVAPPQTGVTAPIGAITPRPVPHPEPPRILRHSTSA